MFAYSIGLSSNSYLKQDITQLSFELFYDSWPLQKGVHLIFLYCVCKKYLVKNGQFLNTWMRNLTL